MENRYAESCPRCIVYMHDRRWETVHWIGEAAMNDLESVLSITT